MDKDALVEHPSDSTTDPAPLNEAGQTVGPTPAAGPMDPDGPSPAAAAPRARPWRRVGIAAVALALGIAVVLILRWSGWVADTRDILEIMGFDPDRAELLASLMAGAIGGASTVLIFGTRRIGVVVVAAGAAVLFGHTLYTETRNALQLQGLAGQFDPAGWALTVLTLVVAAVGVGWATTILALEVRDRAIATGQAVRRAWRQRTIRGVGSRGAVGFALAVGLLAVTLPVLGDVLDYGPQTHMAHGANQPVALFGSGASTEGPPSSSAMPGPTLSAGLQLSSGAVDTVRPWTTSPPTGVGRLTEVELPAPWTGGTRNTIAISIYTPPGYDAGARRYPVLYEVPFNARLWETGMSYSTVMDAAIVSGELPPEITVFVSQNGGPYPVSECADSFDGREHLDTFVSATLVGWMDSNYRTIPTAAARSLFGFSQGGFCAANLLFRHPEIFGQAVSFSGYFVAGMATSQTLNAWRPWGRQPVLLEANSPISAVGQIAPSDRPKLFIVLAGSRTDRPFGHQLVAFAGALSDAGIPYAILPDSIGHSWEEIRADLPTAFALLAARQAHLGVFAGSG